MGKLKQIQSTQDGVLQTFSTPYVPNDNTIPQNTEGTEVMTLSITPQSASSTLMIMAKAFAENSTNVVVTMALFRDSTADALATAFDTAPGDDSPFSLSLTHNVASGSTATTTFKIHLGGTGGTMAFNGLGAGQGRYGGTLSSQITIIEYEN